MPATRKLAAIVFVDVVSYTAMMGKDEQATLRLLEKLRTVLYPLAQNHKGTVLKELGDGALMSFDSALEAVDCATNLQNGVLDIPNLKLRIGIHLGDVVAEEGDVFGSGVNVAARVQPLAVPGGIVVTEDVWKQIKNQPQISFVSLGPRRLKGVGAPVKVFALKREGLAVPSVKQRIASHPAFRKGLIASALLVFVVLSYLFVPEVRQLTAGEVPSIAILYLKNLGPETDEPYTYGITQDLIVDIAKAGLIRVVPMKDILFLQKTELPMGKIAEQLRVRYVMEGSLRREANFFRLTAQIIEAATGKTLWADRVETRVSQAAELQGKLAHMILSALGVTPTHAVAKEITKTRTTNPEAYEMYLRAKYLFDIKKTKGDVIVARGLYEKAVGLDSSFVSAHVGLGQTYELESDYAQAVQILTRALEIAQRSEHKIEEGKCLLALANIQLSVADYPKAMNYLQKSLVIFQELGDHDGEGSMLNKMGNLYLSQGNYSDALQYYSRSLQIRRELSDRRGETSTLNNIGIAYDYQGEYQKALDYYNQSLNIAREIEDRVHEGNALNNIGAIYYLEGAYSEAADYFTQSLNISRALGDRRGESQSMINVGSVHYAQGKHETALQYFQKALSVVRELGDLSSEALAMENIGKIYFTQNNFAPSKGSLHKAIQLFARIDEIHNLVRAYSYLALAYARSGESPGAKENSTHAASILDTAAKPVDFVEICWNLSQTYSVIGDAEKARVYLRYAYNEIMARAEGIRDKKFKNNFLSKVKTNADVLAAWKRVYKQ